jgi:hypothetical protein
MCAVGTMMLVTSALFVKNYRGVWDWYYSRIPRLGLCSADAEPSRSSSVAWVPFSARLSAWDGSSAESAVYRRCNESVLPGRVLLLCQGGARFEALVDGSDEKSFEAADGFAAALSFGAFALEIVTGGGVIAALGDRDPVERRVELTVAAAVEPVALGAA